MGQARVKHGDRKGGVPLSCSLRHMRGEREMREEEKTDDEGKKGKETEGEQGTGTQARGVRADGLEHVRLMAELYQRQAVYVGSEMSRARGRRRPTVGSY